MDNMDNMVDVWKSSIKLSFNGNDGENSTDCDMLETEQDVEYSNDDSGLPVDSIITTPYNNNIKCPQDFANYLNILTDYCHRQSYDAGWWIDRDTGKEFTESSGFATKISLIHSEVSEALEGFRCDLPDEKLPHRPAAEVELADVLVRVFDLAGRYSYDLGGALVEKMDYNLYRSDHKPEIRAKKGGKRF